MRTLLKLFAIAAIIALLAIFHTDITDKFSAAWADVWPAGIPNLVAQSAAGVDGAVTGLMDGVGRAFGR